MKCSSLDGYFEFSTPKDVSGNVDTIRVETERWMLGLTRSEIIDRATRDNAITGPYDVHMHGMLWCESNPHQDMVAEFMKKHNFPRNKTGAIEPWSKQEDLLLKDAANQLDEMQTTFRQHLQHDTRIARAQLILEEVGELMDAFAQCTRKGIADALGDIEYVTLGCAETFGINSGLVFDRIHESNMSKDVGGHKPTGGHKPDLSDV